MHKTLLLYLSVSQNVLRICVLSPLMKFQSFGQFEVVKSRLIVDHSES